MSAPLTPDERDDETYHRELPPGLSRNGLILNAQYAPAAGLLPGGKFDAVNRGPLSGRRAFLGTLRR